MPSGSGFMTPASKGQVPLWSRRSHDRCSEFPDIKLSHVEDPSDYTPGACSTPFLLRITINKRVSITAEQATRQLKESFMMIYIYIRCL